jgi:hypothetical protein
MERASQLKPILTEHRLEHVQQVHQVARRIADRTVAQRVPVIVLRRAKQ